MPKPDSTQSEADPASGAPPLDWEATRSWWGWAAVFFLITAVLLPQLASWGMFVDGVTYAAISRNLSLGIGTWWEPCYTETLGAKFHEHPPLIFVLQSLFFRALGEHYLVEKAYSLATMLATLALIPPIWRLLAERGTGPICATTNAARRCPPSGHPGKLDLSPCSLPKTSWLPVLLWILIPDWNWAYKSNLQENTLSFFCLLAFLTTLRALRARSVVGEAAWSVGSATAILAAFLSKGPVGLFPLVAACLVESALARGRLRRGVRITCLTTALAGLLMAALLTYEPARHALGEYFGRQLLPALSGGRSAGSRWLVLTALCEAFAPMAAILALTLLAAARHQRVGLMRNTVRPALACWLVGLSASLPIMVSLKVRAFYVVPSYPYFALGTALLIAPVLATWVPPAQGRVFRFLHARIARRIVVAGIALLVGVSLCLVGTPRKDPETFHELRALQSVVPRGTMIGTDPREPPDWLLHAVLNRYLLASLDTDVSAADRPFYLAVQGKPFPEGYENTGLVIRGRAVLKRARDAVSGQYF